MAYRFIYWISLYSSSLENLFNIHTHSNWLPSIYKQFVFVRIIYHLFAHLARAGASGCLARCQLHIFVAFFWVNHLYLLPLEWLCMCVCLCLCLSSCGSVSVSLPFSNATRNAFHTYNSDTAFAFRVAVVFAPIFRTRHTLWATLKPQLSWIFHSSGLLCAFPKRFR